MNHITRFHIGMQRTGSTYLFNLLKNHTQIGVSPFQEVHFFTKNNEINLEKYYTLFPREKKFLIDTSPKYFQATDVVLPQIKEYMNQIKSNKIKILILLRNPVEYIYSHWKMQLNQGYFEQSDLYDEIPETIDRFIDKYPQYIERAKYYSNVLKWQETFGVKNVKIILFEDFVKETDMVIKDILSFFEIPYEYLSTVENSMNSQLKSRFLYKMRSYIVKNDKLKRKVKNSKFFNFIYTKFLVEKTKKILNKELIYLKNKLRDDAKKLEVLIQKDLHKKWDVFN